MPDNVENIKGSQEKSTFNSVLAFETNFDMKNHSSKPHMNALAAIPGNLLDHMKTAKPRPISEQEEPQSHGVHNCDIFQVIFE